MSSILSLDKFKFTRLPERKSEWLIVWILSRILTPYCCVASLFYEEKKVRSFSYEPTKKPRVKKKLKKTVPKLARKPTEGR
jgi:hypothetical protein